MDYIQDIRCKEGHLVWVSYVNAIEEIYNFDIKDSPYVMGVQGNLWTERVITGERIDYMIFPRLIAIAERGWTNQENLDYTKFISNVSYGNRFINKSFNVAITNKNSKTIRKYEKSSTRNR